MMLAFRVQELFFDRTAVTGAVDRATRSVLSRFGAYVRRTAKGSIRKAKGPSKPGSPPHSHKGLSAGVHLLPLQPRDPLGGHRAGTVCAFHGRPVQSGTRRHGADPQPPAAQAGARAGVARSASTRARPAKTTKQVEGRHGTAEVTYAKLFTAAQVERANQLNEQLYGPEFIPGVRIEPRPYMGPAFAKETPKLPQMWQDSIKA